MIERKKEKLIFIVGLGTNVLNDNMSHKKAICVLEYCYKFIFPTATLKFTISDHYA